MNLGKQMLFDIRSCAYLWSRLFIMSQSTGESFVTNARKDYSNSVEGTDEPARQSALALSDRDDLKSGKAFCLTGPETRVGVRDFKGNTGLRFGPQWGYLPDVWRGSRRSSSL